MTLFELLAINTLGAALLALAVLAAGLLLRRPETRHVLWLLVLAKLLMPPVIAVAVLPQWAPGGIDTELAESLPVVVESANAPSALPVAAVESEPVRATAAPGIDRILLGAWAAGSFALLCIIGSSSPVRR